MHTLVLANARESGVGEWHKRLLEKMVRMKAGGGKSYHHNVLFLNEDSVRYDFVFVTTNKDASLTLAELAEDPINLHTLAVIIWRYLNRNSVDQAFVKLAEDDDRAWLVTRTMRDCQLREPNGSLGKVTFTVSKN